ncbi:PAS domain S-box protein [uncultured Pseudodesulfovibrio sp.]|uniref:PAS domain S-box protein n=1 Tax=uncultured Pseudodesulfovibrio sp. TaxID=2035858 RepID=UPI0029C84B73|nr:PAS domain S-box protein [uncultured Pseudodesulfovibrio sp.]
MLFFRWKWGIVTTVFLLTALTFSPALAQTGQLASSVAPFSISATERAWLDAHRDVRVGLWIDTPPILFRGKDGQFQGIIVDYMDVIFGKLGVKPRPLQASSFTALWELAKAGEVDVVAAVVHCQDRAGDMLMSRTYLSLPVVVVTRTDYPFIAGLDDLGGKIVAMEPGHVAHSRIPGDYPEIKVLPVGGAKMGLQAVRSGRADAYVVSEAVISYLARTGKFPDIRIAAYTEYSCRLSVGVRKDWPVLKRMIDRALTSMTDQERRSILDRWTVFRDERWVERPYFWRITFTILFVAVTLIGLVSFWNRRLASEIRLREKAEQELRRANETNTLVIESADIIIVGLDYSGNVRLFNRAGERITGYSREEILGKNWFELIVPKERFPYVWEEFNRLQSEGSEDAPETFESPILTKDGEMRHILWRNSSVSDENKDLVSISFGADITKRVRAQEELRLTQFAIDNAAVGIFRVRPSGHIVYANRAASNMLGFTRGELRRKIVPEVVPGISRERWPKFWDRLKYNQMLVFEQTVRRRDGMVIPVEVTAYYLMFKGTELAIGFFSDISERKRVETLREDVERMVRHDLRSPTLAVQTLFKLFDKAENLTDDQQELLESVMKASRRMLNIIDMSRALFKMEAGTYKMRPETVDLLSIMDSVIKDISPLLRFRKIGVSVNVEGQSIEAESVFMIQSEGMLCYALLANLIKNAAEASPEGGMVTVNMSTADEHVITVHNDGVVPDSIRKTFFDKYVTSGKDQGTGLGTYTARLITLTLGGKIHFSSSEGEGTTLQISLPENSETDS